MNEINLIKCYTKRNGKMLSKIVSSVFVDEIIQIVVDLFLSFWNIFYFISFVLHLSIWWSSYDDGGSVRICAASYHPDLASPILLFTINWCKWIRIEFTLSLARAPSVHTLRVGPIVSSDRFSFEFQFIWNVTCTLCVPATTTIVGWMSSVASFFAWLWVILHCFGDLALGMQCNKLNSFK